MPSSILINNILFIHIFNYPGIDSFNHLSDHPPTHFLSVCPSFHPSNIQPSIQHPTIHSNRTIHSSILLCIHPSYKYILYQLWTRHCSRRDMHAELLQPCPTLGNPLDCSPPGSSVHDIFQAKHTGVGCHFLLYSTRRVKQ